MKTLFTFLLSSLVAASALAADVASRVLVTVSGNKEYRITIDGKSYRPGEDRIYLRNVRPGRHTIQVHRVHKNNSRKDQRVYSGSFTVRNRYDTHIRVDKNGKVRVDEERSDRRDWNDRNDRRNDERRWERREADRRWGSANRRALSDADFDRLLQKVRSQWFGKMNTARDGIRDHYFTTRQVRELLQVFSSEGDRLELAKLAYGKTVDPRNYSQLYELFSRKGRTELEQYTRSARF